MEPGAILNPQDIKEQTFGLSLIKGYNIEEVDQFLEAVYQDYLKLYSEREELQQKVGDLTRHLDTPRDSDEIIKQVIASAQQTAEGIVKKAREDAQELMQDINLLLEQKEKFAKEFRDFLKGWLNFLDNYNSGTHPLSKVSPVEISCQKELSDSPVHRLRSEKPEII